MIHPELAGGMFGRFDKRPTEYKPVKSTLFPFYHCRATIDGEMVEYPAGGISSPITTIDSATETATVNILLHKHGKPPNIGDQMTVLNVPMKVVEVFIPGQKDTRGPSFYALLIYSRVAKFTELESHFHR